MKATKKTKSSFKNFTDGSSKETAYWLSAKANAKRLIKGIRRANTLTPSVYATLQGINY